MLPDMPYGYYVLLRWLVCPVFVFMAIASYKENANSKVWVYGVAAAVYNPIAPLALGREVWLVVNVASVLALIQSLRMKSKGR